MRWKSYKRLGNGTILNCGKNKWMDCPTYMTFFRTLTWWSISRPMCKNFTSLLSTLMSKVEFFCWLLFQAKLFAPLLGKRWWCPLRLEIAPWGGRLSYSTVGTPLGMLLIPLPTRLKYKYKYKYKYNTTPLGMLPTPLCSNTNTNAIQTPLNDPHTHSAQTTFRFLTLQSELLKGSPLALPTLRPTWNSSICTL